MGFLMHKLLRVALISAASLTAFVQPAHAEWLRAKSDHFIVYGDMSESEMRRRVERLERFHAALRTLFKVEREDVGTIYMTGSLGELQDLAGSAGVAGFYRGDAQGATGFVPKELPYNIPGMTPETILFHEYTHHILLSSTTALYPGWVSEGLAELFATAKLRPDGSVVIGDENTSRGWAMTGLSRWSVERLLDSDNNPPKGDERIELYSRGWLLLHYLLVSGNRPGQYIKFSQLVNDGKSGLDAGREAFGDLDKLNSEINVYMRSKTFRSYLIEAEKLRNTGEITVATLSNGERAMLPYRMVSANGVDLARAKKLVTRARPVADRYPGDAAVQRNLAEMEFDAQELDRADAAADRALEADPQNLMAMVYKGRVAAKRAVASKDAKQWKTARSWFLRANRRDPAYALPLVLFYDSFVAAEEPIPQGAIDSLGSAVVLAPADSSLRMRMGVEAIRLGNMSLARTILAPVAFDPHGSGKNPFAKLVKDIDAGKSKDELLARAAELKIDRINEFTEPLPEDKEDGAEKKGGDKKGGERKGGEGD